MITDVDLGRIVLVFLVTAGFLALLAYRKQKMTWLVAGYAVLVTGGVLFPLAASIGFAGIWIMTPITLATAAALFFISAYRSNQRINELAAQIEERTVSLEEDI